MRAGDASCMLAFIATTIAIVGDGRVPVTAAAGGEAFVLNQASGSVGCARRNR